jgi:hypothetical protein
MSFSLAATPSPLRNETDAKNAATPTLVPATFRPADSDNIAAKPSDNASAVSTANAPTPTRIQVKRKRSFTPQSDANNRAKTISIETPPSRLILRAKHPLPRALFEADIVDAPTQAQRERQQRNEKQQQRKRNERKAKQPQKDQHSLEESASIEEETTRTTLVETRSSTPIDNIAFYVEKHSTPDWRKMLMTARRLRSLTERVFPVLHLLTIGVYWVDNDSTTSLAQKEAFDRGRALFFNADALCKCPDVHLFLVVCRALCINTNQDIFACIEAHHAAFCAWQDEDQDENGKDNDFKIDIEFEGLFEEFAFRT